jgi:tetrahydromethanopterin S-methyltransferase subunit B
MEVSYYCSVIMTFLLTKDIHFVAIQGTYKEMMWGLMLGFFLGIICLFWFRESVFSRRHQMGIVAGILINVSFGILHVYY